MRYTSSELKMNYTSKIVRGTSLLNYIKAVHSEIFLLKDRKHFLPERFSIVSKSMLEVS